MANFGASYMNLRNPNDLENQDFLQAQGGQSAIIPPPMQAPMTLMNATPRAQAGAELKVPNGANKMSDTQTQQTAQKLKSYMDGQQWESLIHQALMSEPLQMQKQATDEGMARAKDFEDRTKGIDTNNYSAIGAVADQLNQLNNTKSNFGELLQKQAEKNDPRKIQETIIKNYQDAQKERTALSKDTLSSVKDMASGELSNKIVDAQMAGIQAFNPNIANQRTERMFQTARNQLVNDKQLTALGGYMRSLGNGVNQLGANTMPNTLAELQNIANSVAGAGSGLSAAERSEMGLNGLSVDITKLQNYLSGPTAVEGGLKNPIVKQLIERIKAEHEALVQYYDARGEALLDNPTLYNANPAYEQAMRNTFTGMKKSVQFTPQANQIEQANNPPPMGGLPQNGPQTMDFEAWKKANGR